MEFIPGWSAARGREGVSSFNGSTHKFNAPKCRWSRVNLRVIRVDSYQLFISSTASPLNLIPPTLPLIIFLTLLLLLLSPPYFRIDCGSLTLYSSVPPPTPLSHLSCTPQPPSKHPAFTTADYPPKLISNSPYCHPSFTLQVLISLPVFQMSQFFGSLG